MLPYKYNIFKCLPGLKHTTLNVVELIQDVQLLICDAEEWLSIHPEMIFNMANYI